MQRYVTATFIVILLFCGHVSESHGAQSIRTTESAVTILCYMNGDNDLSQEVLYALDMMETVGSSEKVNVIALVDGHKAWLGPYGSQWSRTRMLRLEADAHIGVINSVVLEEWGEENLGSPETLEKFIRLGLDRYPAQRYMFYTFAHSQGVIDTRRLSIPKKGKTVSISSDTTNQSQMGFSEFHNAITRGLNGRRFDLMVLFSCLSNMVEVGYILSDVADYLVGSQDEIRLLNQPPGNYQIRGTRFEDIIATLHQTPLAAVPELGRHIVDTHVDNYVQDAVIPDAQGGEDICRFSAGMALIDSKAVPGLVHGLDALARLLLTNSDHQNVVNAMRKALSRTQRFASFLNLEYYDLKGFVQHLQQNLNTADVLQACRTVLHHLQGVVLYERHTPDCAATGISIYVSNPLVPDNIYRSHQALYAETRFGRDTQWDEMIAVYRSRLKRTPWPKSTSMFPKKRANTQERSARPDF